MGSDGMTIDNQDIINITRKGVTIFNTKGKQRKHIEAPQKWTASIPFGDTEQDILFTTAINSVYTLQINVKGVRY